MGLVLDNEHALDLLIGGNNYFYATKHRIMTHITCIGDGVKIHYEAMK